MSNGSQDWTAAGTPDLGASPFGPDGGELVVSYPGGSLVVWDTATRAVERSTEGYGPYRAASFSPDGKTIACFSRSYGAVLLGASDLRQRRSLGSSDPRPYGLSFSPSGAMVAVGLAGCQITFGDATGGLMAAPNLKLGHTAMCMSFSPNGRWLATGSFSGEVGLWDVAQSRTLATLYATWSDGEWFITTPDGFCDGSATVLESAIWRRGDRLLSDPATRARFHSADRVREVLCQSADEGEDPKAAASASRAPGG